MNFSSVGPTVKLLERRQTDTQTNGTENITSSANAGGNKSRQTRLFITNSLSAIIRDLGIAITRPMGSVDTLPLINTVTHLLQNPESYSVQQM